MSGTAFRDQRGVHIMGSAVHRGPVSGRCATRAHRRSRRILGAHLRRGEAPAAPCREGAAGPPVPGSPNPPPPRAVPARRRASLRARLPVFSRAPAGPFPRRTVLAGRSFQAGRPSHRGVGHRALHAPDARPPRPVGHRPGLRGRGFRGSGRGAHARRRPEIAAALGLFWLPSNDAATGGNNNGPRGAVAR